VQGLPVPLIEEGYIRVPEGPGLGFEGLNEEVVQAFVDPDDSGVFEETQEWDGEQAHDRLWS